MYRVIFECRPNAGQEKKFIRQWKTGSDVIQTYPGALGTKLFRSLSNPKVLFAIAEWKSKIHRDKALAKIEKLPNADFILRGYERYLKKRKVVASLELIAESNPPT